MTNDPADLLPAGRSGLPVLGRPPAERVDAARNRRKILSVAERIVASNGVQGLSMEGLARAAGVGIGTVYRRFGDLGGLAFALLDERERQLQAAFLHGPPPLGPGAAPSQRIRAFLHAYVDRLEVQAELLMVAENSAPTARYDSGAYRVHHTHLATMITQARPGGDASYLADALLASLAASLFVHQRRARAMSTERIKAGLDDLLTGLPERTAGSGPLPSAESL